MVEDERITDDICGVALQTENIEWVCIKKPHAKIYRGRNGRVIFNTNPSADKHYFINRYPYGQKKHPL